MLTRAPYTKNFLGVWKPWSQIVKDSNPSSRVWDFHRNPRLQNGNCFPTVATILVHELFLGTFSVSWSILCYLSGTCGSACSLGSIGCRSVSPISSISMLIVSKKQYVGRDPCLLVVSSVEMDPESHVMSRSDGKATPFQGHVWPSHPDKDTCGFQIVYPQT